MLTIAAMSSLVLPLAPEGTMAQTGDEGQLPEWQVGFSWSYEIDQDINWAFLDVLTIDHIRNNWTQTVFEVLTVGDETHYRVYEEYDGTLSGIIYYDPYTIPVGGTLTGTGWSYLRATDMALINRSVSLTVYTDIPLIGTCRGGMDNFTTYDPPMPMVRYPLSTQSWRTQTTVNYTEEVYLLSPWPGNSESNSSYNWDLACTASPLKRHTVPAGTYDAYEITESGTATSNQSSKDIERTWYYADAAAGAIETWDGYRLSYTDARYIRPNKPPIGPADPIQLVTDEDVPLELDLSQYFSDPEGKELDFTIGLLLESQANATIEGGGTSWTLTPAANWSGTLHLSAEARDPELAMAQGRFNVTVRPMNDPPFVVMAPRDQTTDEDVPKTTAFSLADVFADVDGDELEFGVEAPEHVSASLDGYYIELLPDTDWWGNGVINVTASDPSGAEARSSFKLFVVEVNDAPVIIGRGGDATVHETSSGLYWVEAEDVDSDTLEYQWYLDGVRVGGSDEPSFEYFPGDLSVAQVTVSVTVEDGRGGEVVEQWVVGILDSPRIVSSSPAGAVEALAGDTVTFTVEVADADTVGPQVIWTWLGSQVGTGTQLAMTFTEEDEGEGVLEVNVSDGVGFDASSWTVTVTVPNEPPGVDITSPRDGDRFLVGDTVHMTCQVVDEEVPSLSVEWSMDGSVVGMGTEVDHVVSYNGTLVIQVSAYDGEHTTMRSVTIDVDLPRGPGDGDGDDDDELAGWLFLLVLLVLLVAGLGALWRVRTRRGPRD